MVIGLADTAGEDLDECLTLAGSGTLMVVTVTGASWAGYDSLNLVHAVPLFRERG